MGITIRNISFNGKMIGKDFIPKPPIASFTASPIMGTISFTVQFIDTSTLDPTSWLWDFKNDGTATSTDRNPTYTYTDAGTYSVKLTVSNAGGSNTTISFNLITANSRYPDETASGTNTNTVPLGLYSIPDVNSFISPNAINAPLLLNGTVGSISVVNLTTYTIPLLLDGNSNSSSEVDTTIDTIPLLLQANDITVSSFVDTNIDTIPLLLQANDITVSSFVDTNIDTIPLLLQANDITVSSFVDTNIDTIPLQLINTYN